MADRGQPWTTVDTFETVAGAARKIIELEGSSAYGVFFEIYIETGPGAHSEEEAFGHLEHTGKNSRSYVLKRVRH